MATKKTANSKMNEEQAMQEAHRVISAQASDGLRLANSVAKSFFGYNDHDLVDKIFERLVEHFNDVGDPPETADAFVAELTEARTLVAELYGEMGVNDHARAVLATYDRLHGAFYTMLEEQEEDE